MQQQLKARQRRIVDALKTLGGKASTREIAAVVELDTNGVSQSLGAIGVVHCLGGKGADCRWVLRSDAISHEAARQLVDDFFASSMGPERERKLWLALHHMTDQTIRRGHRVACQPCWDYYMEQKRLHFGA